MPDYYVTVNRPKITATDATAAADAAVSTPLTSDDTVFVKEIDPSGSMFSVAGARVTLGGSTGTPDEVITEATMKGAQKK